MSVRDQLVTIAIFVVVASPFVVAYRSGGPR